MRQKKPSAVRWTCNAQRISLRSTSTLSFFCEHCHQTSWGDFHPSNPIHLQLMAWYQYEMAFCIDYCICRYLNNCHYCNRYLLHKGIGDAGSTADFKMQCNAMHDGQKGQEGPLDFVLRALWALRPVRLPAAPCIPFFCRFVFSLLLFVCLVGLFGFLFVCLCVCLCSFFVCLFSLFVSFVSFVS